MQFGPDLRMPDDLGDQLDALVASGQRDEAAAEVFARRRRRTGRRGDAIALAAALEGVRGAGQHDVDMRFAQSYTLEPRRLAAIKAPVLLLVGSMSPPWMS